MTNTQLLVPAKLAAAYDRQRKLATFYRRNGFESFALAVEAGIPDTKEAK